MQKKTVETVRMSVTRRTILSVGEKVIS